jgi:hypothetical protein
MVTYPTCLRGTGDRLCCYVAVESYDFGRHEEVKARAVSDTRALTEAHYVRCKRDDRHSYGACLVLVLRQSRLRSARCVT